MDNLHRAIYVYFTVISELPGFLGVLTHAQTVCTRPFSRRGRGLGTRLSQGYSYTQMCKYNFGYWVAHLESMNLSVVEEQRDPCNSILTYGKGRQRMYGKGRHTSWLFAFFQGLRRKFHEKDHSGCVKSMACGGRYLATGSTDETIK